ncbi:MAG: hypothetical protein BRD48_06930 [Bacteroidetes bacterium QS_9_68_14]|nr:MAG: hypothetical protein BRD48_06930 [Bacteroidetes bacterium QS_9_68_14]
MRTERLSGAIQALFSSEKARTAVAAAALFLLISAAALISGGNFLGQTLGAAFAPGQGGTNASEAALSAEAEGARAGDAPGARKALPEDQIGSETLWLARCIYSETKRPEEQEFVAWVVRNRVETGYRGNDSYREVVLDPYQFSAFNPGSRKRSYFMSLDASSQEDGWRRALRIAHQVKTAPAGSRPFSKATRHFFSERSMTGRRSPNWSAHGEKVTPEGGKNLAEDRFRFYEDVR